MVAIRTQRDSMEVVRQKKKGGPFVSSSKWEQWGIVAVANRGGGGWNS